MQKTHATKRRPDLGRRTLLELLAATALVAAATATAALAVGSTGAAPGRPLQQAAAILGALLLFVPAAFGLVKRSGLTANPPAWFVGHVLCSAAGAVLVAFHVAGGDLLSPPGVLVLLVAFLVLQGFLARALLAERTSALFGSRVESFHPVDPERRRRIAKIIERKRSLLARLDRNAQEALFSPTLRHALHHPWLTLAYARMAATEARLVGRRRAGPVLAFWRKTHIAAGILLWTGIALHVTVVTLFAGYAAGDGPIYWWHLTAWGGP